jgi:hypothetical protein
MSVYLSCRVVCNVLIPRPENSYRLWSVIVPDLETSAKIRSALLRQGKRRVDICKCLSRK